MDEKLMTAVYFCAGLAVLIIIGLVQRSIKKFSGAYGKYVEDILIDNEYIYMKKGKNIEPIGDVKEYKSYDIKKEDNEIYLYINLKDNKDIKLLIAENSISFFNLRLMEMGEYLLTNKKKKDIKHYSFYAKQYM